MKLSVFGDDKPEPEREVCLRLEAKSAGQRVLLRSVDPTTGEGVLGGNLLAIYPDGTFKIIPGAKFGNVRGFTERT